MNYQRLMLALALMGGLVGCNVAAAQAPSAPAPSGNADQPKYINPVIGSYGKVVQLPKAVHQPRDGSKIAVDITKGGAPGKLNSAIEKVCRFVNIYAGAGKEPATVKIVVVLHGDATLTILNNESYSARFGVRKNPNLVCLQQLKQAGVQVVVCGQSLIGKGARPSEVSNVAKVAVSALSSLVNLQSEGYAFIPLGG